MENNTSPAFGTVANKKKIINDPVWGFLQIPDETTFDLISHPWFQRLRHISQMGMSFLVYPGAVHTRFSHTLGCLYLMQQALQGLSEKGVEIQAGERQAACRAILLHDIGHGPFSHVLERHIASGLGHEDLTSLFMDALNRQMDGKLDTAIAVFRDTYPKKFLHQLVSGQIDVDRLDYLSRDSFHTGVQEGTVGRKSPLLDREVRAFAPPDVLASLPAQDLRLRGANVGQGFATGQETVGGRERSGRKPQLDVFLETGLPT